MALRSAGIFSGRTIKGMGFGGILLSCAISQYLLIDWRTTARATCTRCGLIHIDGPPRLVRLPNASRFDLQWCCPIAVHLSYGPQMVLTGLLANYGLALPASQLV